MSTELEELYKDVPKELQEWTKELKLKEGEEQVANENEEHAKKGHDTKGRFMKGNPGKPRGSRSALTQKMLDFAASRPVAPYEVLYELYTSPTTDDDVKFKASKTLGEWVYYKAPNVEVSMDVEFDTAASIEDQVDLFLERSQEEEQKQKFARIRKYGRDALYVSEEDFIAFEEAYGAVPVGTKNEAKEQEEDVK